MLTSNSQLRRHTYGCTSYGHFGDQRGLYLLDVNLDVLLQVVAVQIKDQVVDKVEAVAHDDERQLIGQFRFLHIHGKHFISGVLNKTSDKTKLKKRFLVHTFRKFFTRSAS